MKRVFLFSSLFVLAAAGAANGCVTRERVIVVKEPSDKTAPVATDGTSNGDTGSKPIATDDTGIAQNDESDWGIKDPSDSQEYGRVIAKVANMVSDSDLSTRVRRRNLSLVNVTWEDTGRAQGSALGPNISDLTLQVRRRDPSGRFESRSCRSSGRPTSPIAPATSPPTASSSASATSRDRTSAASRSPTCSRT